MPWRLIKGRDDFSFSFKCLLALLISIFLPEEAGQAGIVRTSLSDTAIRSECPGRNKIKHTVGPALK
jgi:hypothetical protein